MMVMTREMGPGSLRATCPKEEGWSVWTVEPLMGGVCQCRCNQWVWFGSGRNSPEVCARFQ